MKKTVLFLATLLMLSSIPFSAHAAIEDVEAFVTRFYQQCLNREPDTAGLNNWVNSLMTGELGGADVAEGFVFSQEFINSGMNYDSFLTILYRAFFDREPDSAGYNSWEQQLLSGATREDVLDGFLNAQEFLDLCASYGISPFSDSESAIGDFVIRFYQQCLNRGPDEQGLEYWEDALSYGNLTGSEVAQGFVLSQEFINRDTTNEEYLTILYRAFFDREADQGGLDYWFGQLNSGTSREEVLNGFINAQEFANLCNTYGISVLPDGNCVKVGGTWFGTFIDTTNTCDEELENEPFSVTILQDGCEVTMYDTLWGDIWTATLIGNEWSFTLDGIEEGGGIINADFTMTFSRDVNSFSGPVNWTWTDGLDTCGGVSEINCNRTN